MAMLKGNLIDAANRAMAAASIKPAVSTTHVLTIWKAKLSDNRAWIMGNISPYTGVNQ